MANCAKCHGVTGDGNGTEQLDRPARSFLAGGVSFGNTNQAIRRVVQHGIAGTPMPGFVGVLNRPSIDAVVAYARDGTPIGEEHDYETRFIAPDVDGSRTVKGVRAVEALALDPATDPESLEDIFKKP
ncbi:MAG: hypothetical protein CMJ63_02255 [Planctomycetaceae bacterium]|nr:hypothetical protein [Planctomycetaceae bacterium]